MGCTDIRAVFASGPALHIPDGFLSAPVAAAGYVVMGAALVVTIRVTDRNLGERTVPLMGGMGAFYLRGADDELPGRGGHLRAHARRGAGGDRAGAVGGNPRDGRATRSQR